MIRIPLERFLISHDGVFGLMTVRGMHLFTCEEEDLGNLVSLSCIPIGTYRLERTIYHKHGYETFEVMDVPNRRRILFHPGNTEEDTEGCILPGMSLGVLEVRDEDTHAKRKKLAVLSSKRAFDHFMAAMMGVDEAELVIKHYRGSM